jgi:hypothetical protein
MNISRILLIKFPQAEWTLTGEDYEGLTWLSDTPKPTKKQLESQWKEVQEILAAAEQARVDAKASTIAKLQALGLTPEEVKVAFGLEQETN